VRRSGGTWSVGAPGQQGGWDTGGYGYRSGGDGSGTGTDGRVVQGEVVEDDDE
jgi:hypothetical protein